MNKQGFTISEAVVIVSIVGVMGIVAVPKLIIAGEGLKASKQKQELAAIYQAQLDYVQDTGNYATSLTELDITSHTSTSSSLNTGYMVFLNDGSAFGAGYPNCVPTIRWIAKTIRPSSGFISTYQIAITDDGEFICAPCDADNFCSKIGIAVNSNSESPGGGGQGNGGTEEPKDNGEGSGDGGTKDPKDDGGGSGDDGINTEVR